MTLDEMKNAASSGDVKAMIALGEYYEDQTDSAETPVEFENYFLQAIDLYEKARDQGNTYAAFKAVAACTALVELYEGANIPSKAELTWRRGAVNATRAIPSAEAYDEDRFNLAMSMLEECVYFAAAWTYLRDDYVGALQLLKTIGVGYCKRADVLYAECTLKSVSVLDEETKSRIVPLVHSLYEKSCNYITKEVVGQSRPLEQLVLAKASRSFSALFSKRDTADAVISIAREALTDQKALEILP